MGFNNKSIVKGSDESWRFITELLSYGDDKIKDNCDKNITSDRQ